MVYDFELNRRLELWKVDEFRLLMAECYSNSFSFSADADNCIFASNIYSTSDETVRINVQELTSSIFSAVR